LNVRVTEGDGGNITHATVYVPARQETYFIGKVNEYINRDTPSGAPRNNNLINSIESVQMARLIAFWTDTSIDLPSNDPVWCEAWLSINTKGSTETIKSARETLLTDFAEVCELYDINNKVDESSYFRKDW
jgi:hypothetical protein